MRYFKNPVQTGAFCETEEQFPGKMFVQFYVSLKHGVVWAGRVHTGALLNCTPDSMALQPPVEDNFASVSSRKGVHLTMCLAHYPPPPSSSHFPSSQTSVSTAHRQTFTVRNYLIKVGRNLRKCGKMEFQEIQVQVTQIGICILSRE